jgi:hypothetical protein
MTVHKYIDDESNTSISMSGEFGCHNWRIHRDKQTALIFPTGTTLPAPTHADGQLLYIPTSGALAITRDGEWKITYRSAFVNL